MQFLVVTRPVRHGEEFFTDYGEEYWAALVGQPAPDAAPAAAPPPSTARRPRAPSAASSDDEDAVVAAMMGLGDLSSDDDSDRATLDGRIPDMFKVRPKQAA